MALKRDAYKALEDIVGPEHISEDPAVRDSYALMRGFGSGTPILRPNVYKGADAIVAPGSAEEVRRVVQACNRYGVKFKAHSTGTIFLAFPFAENAISIDLRRLNRILEINERDCYAIIEPYVTCGELNVEAMRHGLCTHITGGGPAFSALASATSGAGFGESGITRGFSGRNVLALEWVLGNGDILHLGSLQTPGAGWFCGDGPGPGLFGAVRGSNGALGERGIFTAVALKLYPWYGPREFETLAGPPWFDVDLWELGRVVSMYWDGFEDESKGMYGICEAEIFDTMIRIPILVEGIPCQSYDDYVKVTGEGAMTDHMAHLWQGLIVGKSPGHLEYCLKALRRIEADTRGRFCYDFEELAKQWRVKPDGTPYSDAVLSVITPNALKQSFLQTLIFRNWHWKACFMPLSTVFMPCPTEAADCCLEVVGKVTGPLIRKYQTRGFIKDEPTVPRTFWMQPEEGGHSFHLETMCRYEAEDPQGDMATIMAEGIMEKYRRKVPDWYTPNIEQAGMQKKYIQGIRDVFDPDHMTTDMHMAILDTFRRA